MLGERIREARKAKRLTQQQLADLLNVAKSTVSQYETNTNDPGTAMLAKIAEALGTSTDSLLDGGIVDTEAAEHARELPGWKSEEEIQEFVQWIKENVDGTFFYDFKNTPEDRKRTLAQMLSDQKLLWEMERRKRR